MSDNVTWKDALHEQSRGLREQAKMLQGSAAALGQMADSLALLAGEIAKSGDAVAAAPAAATGGEVEGKKKRGPKPAVDKQPETPAAPTVTLAQVQAAMTTLYGRNKDWALAVLARNGIKKLSTEAKPENYAKILADIESALAGNDPNAASAAPGMDFL